MKNLWFTSDHHFGHTNIIKYCNRPFKDADEMDKELINRWNEVVGPDDDVWHLGDFTLQDNIDKYIERLNGNIYFVRGGHDQRWMERHFDDDLYTKTGKFHYRPSVFSLEFDVGEKYPLVIALCHYALRVWDRSHYGSLHLYGHSHGNLDPWPNSMDVGVDCHNFYPISLEQVLEQLR